MKFFILNLIQLIRLKIVFYFFDRGYSNFNMNRISLRVVSFLILKHEYVY